jgi:peptidoglycan/LPS O-acetylase OafA/YrhL
MTPAPSSDVPGSPGRDNCFDLLRLLLASLVLYSHTHMILPAFGPEWFESFTHGQTNAGSLAVLGFFGLSGFLVTGSSLRSPSIWRFVARRAIRILPGFWVCLTVTAFAFGPALYYVHHRALDGFPWLGKGSAASFVYSNATLRIYQWDIVGVNITGISLNGSLWTLYPEFCCYLVVGALSFAAFLHRNRVFLGVAVFAAAVFHIVANSVFDRQPTLVPTLIGLTKTTGPLLAFLIGAVVCVFRDHVRLERRAGLFFLALAAIMLRYGGFTLMGPVIFVLAVLNLGYSFSCALRWDLSYGVYVYGAPVQHLLAALGFATGGAIGFIAVSLAVSYALAAVSWMLIEHPAIRWGRKLA